MRTLSADWMANTSKPESDLQSHGGDESKGSFFYPRPVAPTATQVLLIYSTYSCFYVSCQDIGIIVPTI
jgi:hypothetical protein